MAQRPTAPNRIKPTGNPLGVTPLPAGAVLAAGATFAPLATWALGGTAGVGTDAEFIRESKMEIAGAAEIRIDVEGASHGMGFGVGVAVGGAMLAGALTACWTGVGFGTAVGGITAAMGWIVGRDGGGAMVTGGNGVRVTEGVIIGVGWSGAIWPATMAGVERL